MQNSITLYGSDAYRSFVPTFCNNGQYEITMDFNPYYSRTPMARMLDYIFGRLPSNVAGGLYKGKIASGGNQLLLFYSKSILGKIDKGKISVLFLVTQSSEDPLITRYYFDSEFLNNPLYNGLYRALWKRLDTNLCIVIVPNLVDLFFETSWLPNFDSLMEVDSFIEYCKNKIIRDEE